jgi:hypothetical protein
MEKGWSNIFNSADEYLISIAKDLLQDNGIESVVINHKDSAYVMWGELELYVREENERQSMEILKQLKKG